MDDIETRPEALEARRSAAETDAGADFSAPWLSRASMTAAAEADAAARAAGFARSPAGARVAGRLGNLRWDTAGATLLTRAREVMAAVGVPPASYHHICPITGHKWLGSAAGVLSRIPADLERAQFAVTAVNMSFESHVAEVTVHGPGIGLLREGRRPDVGLGYLRFWIRVSPRLIPVVRVAVAAMRGELSFRTRWVSS